MSVAEITKQIADASAALTKAYEDLNKEHVKQADIIAKAYAQQVYELKVRLQIAQAKEDFVGSEEEEGWLPSVRERSQPPHSPMRERSPSPVEYEAEAEDETQYDPCYHCGHHFSLCVCGEEEEAAAVAEADRRAAVVEADRRARLEEEANHQEAWGGEEPNHREGTKLKWVSSTNPETYSVAIVKKDGILEVKRVTDGGGHCHDHTTCECVPCSEIRLSERLGAPMPSWLRGAPLLKTFFATEADWLNSLPDGGRRGSLQTTVPAISARKLKKLCCTPLSGETDALKLKELQERFSGATMVISAGKKLLEVEHVYYDMPTYPENWRHQIYSKRLEKAVFHFTDLGESSRSNGKPQLMAEWKGLYIDLSHLF